MTYEPTDDEKAFDILLKESMKKREDKPTDAPAPVWLRRVPIIKADGSIGYKEELEEVK
jgi:hypothetical protein